MTATLSPPAPLVGIAWLATVPALTGITATQQLDPNGAASWAGDIAITVAVVPTTPDQYTPIRSVLLQVDIWGRPNAGTEASRNLPWNRCHSLAESIRDATYAVVPAVLTVAGTSYLPARVTDVSAAREPYRAPTDASGLARVLLQIQLTYLIA